MLYVPLADVDQGLLGPVTSTPTARTRVRRPTSTSWRATATGGDGAGAVWYYPEPYSAVEAIRDHVAFYADRVAITSDS